MKLALDVKRTATLLCLDTEIVLRDAILDDFREAVVGSGYF